MNRVGIIGTGFIGPAHIEALRRLGSVEVVALAERDEALAREKAAQLNVPSVFSDYRDLLKMQDIDAVHICSPNHLHYPMAKEALAAGMHVICEKPLAIETWQARELTALAKEKGLVNAVHFNIRYYPLMRQVKTMMERGEIGEMFSVLGSYLQDWLFHPTDYNWRLEPEQSGPSRAVADIGSHWMDLIEYVSGERIIELMADLATFHKQRHKPLKPIETYAGKVLKPEDYEKVPIHTEDYATVLFHFANGAHGAMSVNQVAAGRKNRLSFELHGSRCAVGWDSESPNQLWVGNRDGRNETLLRDPSLVHESSLALIDFPGGHNEGFPDTSKQLFKEVYADIAGGGPRGEPCYPTFDDGLRELVLCEAILDSHEKKSWVKVTGEEERS